MAAVNDIFNHDGWVVQSLRRLCRSSKPRQVILDCDWSMIIYKVRLKCPGHLLLIELQMHSQPKLPSASVTLQIRFLVSVSFQLFLAVSRIQDKEYKHEDFVKCVHDCCWAGCWSCRKYWVVGPSSCWFPGMSCRCQMATTSEPQNPETRLWLIRTLLQWHHICSYIQQRLAFAVW